jgi:hypothetical protein
MGSLHGKKSEISLWAGQIRAKKAELLRAITFQGFGMAKSNGWIALASA